VIECFNHIGYIAPKKFFHNSMNLTHIGLAHIMPVVTVLHFTLLIIVLVKVHVYLKEITQYTHSR